MYLCLDNIGCSYQKSYCYVDSNKNCFIQLRYGVEKKYYHLQRVFFSPEIVLRKEGIVQGHGPLLQGLQLLLVHLKAE